MERILEKALKIADQAEVFQVYQEETPVGFESNRLKHLRSRQITSIVLRLMKKGRIGLSTTTNLADEDGLVARAVETTQFGAPARFEFPARLAYSPVEVYDPAVEKVSVEEMAAQGEALIARVQEANSEVLWDAGVTKVSGRVRLLNSRGGQATYAKTVFSLSLEGTLVRGTDMLFVGESASSCHPLSDSAPLARSVLEQLELGLKVASAPSGQLPVVFTPRGVASAFLLPLTIAFNGRTVFQGASPLGKRLGERVFTEKLSLWDEATLAFRPGSRLCDDEGVPSQRTLLIEKGMVANFLYDLQTAGLAGKKSTGNGSRMVGGGPGPWPTTLVIAPGEVFYEDMIADIREGLVVDQLLGAGQGNILGGEFGGNVLLGYKVEKGKLVGRVKNTVISGNIYEVLKEVTALGKEAKWVGGTALVPAFYCPRVSVSHGGTGGAS